LPQSLYDLRFSLGTPYRSIGTLFEVPDCFCEPGTFANKREQLIVHRINGGAESGKR
jgi:hypothetical protein